MQSIFVLLRRKTIAITSDTTLALVTSHMNISRELCAYHKISLLGHAKEFKMLLIPLIKIGWLLRTKITCDL